VAVANALQLEAARRYVIQLLAYFYHQRNYTNATW